MGFPLSYPPSPPCLHSFTPSRTLLRPRAYSPSHPRVPPFTTTGTLLRPSPYLSSPLHEINPLQPLLCSQVINTRVVQSSCFTDYSLHPVDKLRATTSENERRQVTAAFRRVGVLEYLVGARILQCSVYTVMCS